MFIELTKANGGGKCQLPVQSMDGFEAKERGGTIIRMKDSFRDVGSRHGGPEIHVVESPAAIRSALLKAGLLVVVEEEAQSVATREPSDGPTKARLEDMSFEKLFEQYAFHWRHDYAADARRKIIAVANERVARAFEQGRAAGLNHDKNRVPVPLILSDDGLRNSSIEQLLAYRDAYWSSLWGHLSDKESKRVIAELQRRIESKPPLEFPPASAVIDLSKTTIEGLCQAYAMWHGYPITDHPHDMRDAVIAELQRRIESKPERVVVKLWIQRLPDSMHPNMVSVYVKNRYTKATVTQWCEESRAKEWAESMVRIVNPSARIEWENET